MERSLKETPAQGEATPDPNLLFEHTLEVESHTSLKNRKVIGYKWRGKNRPASGSRKIPFLRTDTATKLAQNLLVLELQARARRILLSRPWDCPMLALWSLELTNFTTKKGTINKRAGDLTNLIQGCEDALTKAGIIADDSLIVQMKAEKKQSLDGVNRIHIKLFSAI